MVARVTHGNGPVVEQRNALQVDAGIGDRHDRVGEARTKHLHRAALLRHEEVAIAVQRERRGLGQAGRLRGQGIAKGIEFQNRTVATRALVQHEDVVGRVHRHRHGRVNAGTRVDKSRRRVIPKVQHLHHVVGLIGDIQTTAGAVQRDPHRAVEEWQEAGLDLDAADGIIFKVGDQEAIPEGIASKPVRIAEVCGEDQSIHKTRLAGDTGERDDAVVGGPKSRVVGRQPNGVIGGIRNHQSGAAEPENTARTAKPCVHAEGIVRRAREVLVVAADQRRQGCVGRAGTGDELDGVIAGVGDPEVVGVLDGHIGGLIQGRARHGESCYAEIRIGKIDLANDVVKRVRDVKNPRAVHGHADGDAEFRVPADGSVISARQARRASESAHRAVGEVDEADEMVAGVADD